jgi:CHAT domain-containing protein
VRSTSPATRILAVGNPAFDRARNPGLSPLPFAEREAASVAALYRPSVLLSGAAATREEVLKHMASASIVHFAGHAVHNEVAPAMSYLLLAPSSPADDGRFHASEIAALQLRGTRLVVLGACSTGTGVARFGEGPLTIARPFLAAGVPSVVASLWDVDDGETAKIMIRFHALVLEGRPAAAALRQAQLGMLSSADPADRDPRNWGAFITIGTMAGDGDPIVR